MQPLILAIMSILATLIGALIGASFPYIYKKYGDRKARRIKPSISIWYNVRDNIDDRLTNGQATRWFLDIENLSKYMGKCLYFVIRSENEYLMLRSNVSVVVRRQDEISGKPAEPINFKTGLIDSQYRTVLPVPYTNDVNSIECRITYYTEKNEKMMYKITFDINSAIDKMHNRCDTTYLMRESYENQNKENDTAEPDAIKTLSYVHIDENECFTSNEIQDKLREIGGKLYRPQNISNKENNNGNSN